MRNWLVFIACVYVAVAGLQAVPAPPDDAKILTKAGLGDDDAKLVDYFRRRVVTDADCETIRQLIRALGSETYIDRERATAEIVKWGIPAVNQLRTAIKDPDVEIAKRAEACLKRIEKVPGADLAAAVARTLAKKKPEGAADALLSFLPFVDDVASGDEVREALAAIALASPRDAALLAALNDTRPLRRGAAGEALLRANVADARRLLDDPDAGVRLSMVVAAVTRAKDKLAVTKLIDLLAEAPPAQAWRAEDVLVRLAGESAPAISIGKGEAARKRCRDTWAEWWSRVAASIDLNKLDTLPGMLGYTLIVDADLRSPTGRVYEVNSAGEILWKIDNVIQPFDALVIGKDRVLIAEGNSYQISLRDFRGNTITTKQIMAPHSFQLLPNNRILVGGRAVVFEWDEKQSEKFNFQRDRGQQDICAACRTKNGELWLVTQTGQCVRIDGQKKEIKSFPVAQGQVGYGALIGMDALSNGHVLIAFGSTVTEFDANGNKAAWSVKYDGRLSSVQRLNNGNTLIAGLNDRRVIEIDRDKEVSWEFAAPDGCAPRKAKRR